MSWLSSILNRPSTYGFLYLVAIPLYAVAYWQFSLVGEISDFLDALYFSAITITTLGYGDVLPLNTVGKVVSASESLLGVVLIGLFLNTLSAS